jgi:protein SCO1/2
MKARAVLSTIAAAFLAVAYVAPTPASEVSQPLPALERVMQMNPPRAIAPFKLTDQRGKARAWSTFAGKPMLVFFGFTNCPDVCPTTLQRVAQVKAAQGAAFRDLQVVMISVDGERDTPAALAAYLAHFSNDFVGLTGSAAEVREIALRFAAPFFKDPKKSSNYLVQHSSRLYAIDRQGRLRAELYDATPDATTTLARALLAEPAHP